MSKIKKLKVSSKVSAVMYFVSAALAGFVFTGEGMSGISSLADISLCGSLDVVSSSAVLVGSLIRSVISGNIGKNIVKTAAMIIIVTAKLFFESCEKPKPCGIITTISILASGTAVSIILDEVFYKLFFYIFFGSVAGLAAYSTAYIRTGLKKQAVIELSGRSGCAYAIVYITMISSLCKSEVFFINFGIIAGTAITLLAAYYYRHTGGVLCGALTACGAFLASSETGMTVVLLPAAGLMTGYIHKQKPVVAAVFFAVLSFMLMILTGISKNNTEIIFNIICGCVLFIFTAPYYSDKWVSTGNDSSTALPEIINARMSFLSDSIGTVRTETGKIAEALAENTKDSNELSIICSKVCNKCFRKDTCWTSERDSTVRSFRKLAGMPEINPESFPRELEYCLHKHELTREFSKLVRERMTAKILRLRSDSCRELLSEQIKITEEIIRCAGEKIDVRYSSPISRIIAKKLSRYNINPRKIIAYYNAYNRLIIELYFLATESPDNTVRLCDLASDELEIRLDISGPVYSGREVRFRLFEKPLYSLEVYGASMCAEGSDTNGDTSTVFTDGTGIGYVILSDGMGTGKSAALESRLVVRMFRKLINSGINCTAAVKLINSIMVSKSGDEAFATLDAMRIDLDSCGLTVIKSGASATLIRHNGNVLKVTSPTFPIGIYEQSDVFSSRYSFEDGDMAVMFSDGIDESEYSYIKELLLAGDNVKNIVNEICSKARVYNPSARSDDITVIGIRVTRRNEHSPIL